MNLTGPNKYVLLRAVLSFYVAVLPVLSALSVKHPWSSECILLSGAAVSSAVVIFFCLAASQKSLRIKKTDLIFALLMLWQGVVCICCNHVRVDLVVVCSLGFYVILYTLGRIVGIATSLPFAVFATGVLQAFVALFQWIGVIESGYLWEQETGTFDSPALLGNMLALSIPIGICLLSRVHTHVYRCILVLALGLLIVMVIHSNSRAAWLACAVSLCYVLQSRWNFFRRIMCNRLCRTVVVLIFIAGLVVLYAYKPASALGRLLIWRVCASVWLKAPIIGHGLHAFRTVYMPEQAIFCSQHPESTLVQYADNVMCPYNELLRTICNTGIVGLVLLLWLSMTLYRDNTSFPLRSMWVAMAVFSQFSYPCDEMTFSVIFILLASGMAEGARIEKDLSLSDSLSRRIKQFGAALALAICMASVVGIGYYRHPSPRHLRYNKEYIQKTVEQQLFELKKTMYASVETSRSRISRATLETLFEQISQIPTIELYIEAGEVCLFVGDTLRAEQYYRSAANMSPRRMQAKYQLFDLYRMQGDTCRAWQLALDIMTQVPKVENTRTIIMRHSVQEYISTISPGLYRESFPPIPSSPSQIAE